MRAYGGRIASGDGQQPPRNVVREDSTIGLMANYNSLYMNNDVSLLRDVARVWELLFLPVFAHGRRLGEASRVLRSYSTTLVGSRSTRPQFFRASWTRYHGRKEGLC